MPDQCIEWVDPSEAVNPGRHSPEGLAPCGRPALEHLHWHMRSGVWYGCGRAYCEFHGGDARARAEAAAAARACPHTLAPPRLSRAQVDASGAPSFSPERVYGVVRQQASGWWTGGLGIGEQFYPLTGTWPDPKEAEMTVITHWLMEMGRRITWSSPGGPPWIVPVPQRPRVVRIHARPQAPREHLHASFWSL